jgi:hypothetical protein
MRDWLAVLFGVSVLVAGCGSSGGPRPPASPDQAVADFVKPTYPHGVPYDEARQLGAQSVSMLKRLLDDQSMVEDRGNILTVIGMLGSDAAESTLIDYVQAGSGPLKAEEVSLRLDALTALGYAANVATSATTLEYLIGGLDTANWPKRVAWRLASGGDPSARLRQRSMAALGLSGKPEALTALQTLRAQAAGPVGRRGGGGGGGGRGGAQPPILTPSEQALLDNAIETNQFVSANGLSVYYRRFRR